MKTVTGKTNVWASRHSRVSPNNLETLTSDEIISGVQYFESGLNDWAKVGTAEITITFDDSKEIIKNRVNSMRVEATNIRAEATNKCTQIEREIQSLLAIEHTQ